MRLPWAVEPLTGEGLFYEFTHLDTVCFEKFLELFVSKYHDDLHIVQVDKVGFHNSLNLSIPENVILLFPPAYSPEVNPIEKLWGYITIVWTVFLWLNGLLSRTLSHCG